MNPVPVSEGLQLNVNEADSALDLDLAREVAPYFRVAARDLPGCVDRSVGY